MASIISAGTTTNTAINISGDTSGNLAFTTQNGANTITVPNTTGTVALTSGLPASGQLCKAWVNFAGSNGTINGSYNVSSVTRYNTGQYGISFTTAMPNANYAISLGISGQNSSSGNGRGIINTNTGANGGTPTTSIFYIQTTNSADIALQDQQLVCASVFSS
jgi:hypothetical protein